ncbi:SixA phosphatase family protein [Gluconobacter sphaericus]|uniref:Phosphohistidine phosphatase n=1 Tax=Gluconobacter sphaericus NBRC 12467 TaxID=1307951 RepID=A0AA37WAN4_9PROT|nr:histidine phosphatase family protein [Gluconobacter sphaericus]MBF0884305.1 phosphohistidine phosphatase [Gluconobacter sphaericus]GBR52839.1 phosphohistidine phosphatase [Gluconobacter sphaericus NBRC 12467]GEB42455.1 phosphohistidine phosphatase [Gluconobacter sphaericus NBRC 12467]GLQ83799.1 phosphohistidine phosphatase [Gluconobacter sphaericus NBRC 12467]
MRCLLLLRHAEAVSHLLTAKSDSARALTPKGQEQAASIGRQLSTLDLPSPIRILCSPAIRTRQTTQGVLAASGTAASLEIEESLYSATADDLYSLIYATPETAETLLIVGHNPTIGEFACDLLGPALQSARFSALYRSYPLAGLTVLGVQGQWLDVRPSTIQPITLIQP